MPDELPTCIELPPWTPSMRGSFLYIDGERLAWSDPPTAEQQYPAWSDQYGWVMVNPAALRQAGDAPKEAGPPPRKLPDDLDQPM